MEHTPPFTLDERFFALSEIWLNERARTILQENHVTSARDFLRCMKNKTLRLSPSDAMMSALFSYAFSRMYQTRSKNRPPKEKELELLKINRMGMEPLPGDLPSEKEFWALANARLSIFARAALKTHGITSVRAFMSLTRQVIFLIPLLLIFPRLFELNGVWGAMPVSDTIATLVTLLMLWQTNRKLGQNNRVTPAA